MFQNLKKLKKIMSKKQKRHMTGLVVIMFFGAVLETVSVSLMLPLVSAIMQPSILEGEGIFAKIAAFLHIESRTTFIVVSLLGLIIMFILKDVFLFWQHKRIYRFVYTNQFDTAGKLLQNYVQKDYEYYLHADTAVIQRCITVDIVHMYAMVLAYLQMASELIVFVCLGIALLLVDPWMTLVLVVLLAVTLLIIKNVIKPIMNKNGRANQDYGAKMNSWISQTVSSIKEVKVGGKEAYFTREYMQWGEGYVKAMENYCMFANTPKLFIEAVCVTGMLLYMMIQVLRGNDVSVMIPAISAFALAAVRLMPSASRINNQITQIAFCEPFFRNVSDNLLKDVEAGSQDVEHNKDAGGRMPVKQEIRLENITYRYPGTEKAVLNNVSLTIPVGESIGIIGESGAGKTTLVDILLGLLKPEAGCICVDGEDIQGNYPSFLKNVGYIPQMIGLLNDDIVRNVAFGVPKEETSEEQVKKALEEASLLAFVEGLPGGLHENIGERGIRLSGGQRQRIGIARALYGEPEVLILDEATSSLDGETERAVMEAMNHLQGKKTMIIIAHRRETLASCDHIYRVEQGQIVKEV
ncbi:MAG: ABC transporter ATP-binding protein/permease [Lachnospiraceae bacterium]|nr:ABC transporter ATP-binding protein/permease [Lachnospiraceae bacterium]